VHANARKSQLHQEAIRVWQAFQNAKAHADASGRDAPPPPKNPKQPNTYMTRAPSEQCGNLESPWFFALVVHHSAVKLEVPGLQHVLGSVV
jgi:hypothetical protein